ncbi:MAG: TetR/AcrR family transcriptional regulator [Firmicutes bacterium]|nr:TetR/AcrR family transcriptional regulator [Bacillota bacterium]
MKKLSKKEKTKIKIMHAAKGLFESYGIENVTFVQIAESAEVCRTTVFNHFSDSRELMLALTKQEINDVEEYCTEAGWTGCELAYNLFAKLIEDASIYPKLTAKLMTNAILSQEEDNPIKTIERMIINGFSGNYGEEEAKRLAILISGAYYGLINHYHINNKYFDCEKMKKEFKDLLSHIIDA